MNKIINKSIATFLALIIIFSLFPSSLFAQPVTSARTDNVQNLPGFNKSAFDSYFSKADRELTPERWLSEAKTGIAQAIHAWELFAVNLYENPLLFEEAKYQLEKWSSEEMEARFSQWLIGRFFGEAAEKALMELSSKLSEAQKNYSWHLDDEGNILFDDKTGTILVIRPDDNREFSRDLLMWRNEAEEILNDNYVLFDNVLENYYTELLAYIPEDMRGSVSLILKEISVNYGSVIKKEFENIAEREERILTSRRTRDILSLRKQSDEEAARLFTQKLITETEKSCIQGIEALTAQIEAAYAGTGDLAIMGEDWLRLYKEQFDRGLKAWEEAEERFFIRRIEWEQESFKLFSEGEEIWMEAFAMFQEEQRKWELQAKELFEAGEQLFKNISEEFEKNIADAKKEFELNMASRIGEGTTKVKALIDMYLISSSAAISAKEHYEFWESQPGYDEEAKKSYDLYVSYLDKALDARSRIMENYAELIGTGALKDILSPNASGEDFFLDEYQIALIRAKALVLYWERKTAIAEAVADYAQEFSADRLSEAEGIRAWEAAKTAYNNSIAAYEEELAKLTRIGEDIQKQQEKLSDLALIMHEEEMKLNQLNKDYNEIVAARIINRSEFFLIEMNIKYESLQEIYKQFYETELEESFKNDLKNGLKWGIAEQREIKLDILDYFLSDEEIISEAENAVRLAGIEMLQDNISGSDWYYRVKGKELKEENIYTQLVKDFEDAYFLYLEEQTDENIYEYNLCLGLVELYNNLLPYCSFIQQELWKITDEKLSALFKDYCPEEDDSYLPNAAALCDSIINKNGDIIYNFVSFIQEFDNCFVYIPEWLDYEIDIWKNSLIEYFTVYLSSDNNEKHWRQFIYEGYIKNTDEKITGASSWKEGMIADALFSAEYFSNRLNYALIIFSESILGNSIEDDLSADSEYYFELYSNSIFLTERTINLIKALYEEIGISGKAYDFSLLNSGDKEDRLEISYDDVVKQELIFNSIRNEYFNESQNFLYLGSLYDDQYSKLKKVHELTDQKRFEYEKQDAIQRWASTAYLGVDFDNLENSRTNLQRAKTVLTVLSDLYNNESERPYENPEYQALYEAYKISFNRKIKSMEAYEIVRIEIDKETINNINLFNKYQEAIHTLTNMDLNYNGYFSSDNLSDWNKKDLITVKDGKLVLLTDEKYTFTGIDEIEAEKLNDFFTSELIPEGERHSITTYEESLRELSERLSVYFSNPEKFRQWSLARDYLILNLINNNADLEFLNNYHVGIREIDKDGSLENVLIRTEFWSSNKPLSSVIDINSLKQNGNNLYWQAWNSLSEQEKKDLEYYVILTLTNSTKDYFYGMSQYYALDVYNSLISQINGYISTAQKKVKRLMIAAFFSGGAALLMLPGYNEWINVDKFAVSRITPLRDAANKYINNWTNGLSNNLALINSLSQAYLASCDRLDRLEGYKEEGEYVKWSDIEISLLATERLNEEQILELKNIWNEMQEEVFANYTWVPEALADMCFWAKDKEETAKIAFNSVWENDSFNQKENDKLFVGVLDAYMSGNTGIDELKTAANNAFGKNAAAYKNHFNNMQSALINDLSIYSDLQIDFYNEFGILANELVNLTAKALETRYRAEYTAREIEWELQLRDISEKYDEWQYSASLIFENGRKDWASSAFRMEEAYKQWTINFHDEYNRVSDEWAMAYLAGLEEKEKWLETAAAAANEASSEAFLLLIGAEGERLARVMDTRNPLGIRNALPQAQNLMSELLQSSGIANMYNAFGAINNVFNTVNTRVIRGLGGPSIWDSSLTKIAAADLAKKTNDELAERETRRLAHNASLMAQEIINNLQDKIDSINEEFEAGMDDHFIFKGHWSKNGNNYVKKVIKGSTFFVRIISKSIEIPGYEYFTMEPVSVSEYLDENYLTALDTIAIRWLIESVYYEVEALARDYFGDENQEGKIFIHIGNKPKVKENGSFGDTKESIFDDYGDGELGRLLTDFIYWQIVEAKGNGELMLPPWDRRLWDDTGSWFKAPSLRQLGAIAVSAVAAWINPSNLFITALIITSSDILFSAMDMAFGYKNFAEGLFDITKSFALNATMVGISHMGKGINESIKKINNPIKQIATQTASAGLTSTLTSFTNTVYGSLTYSSADGLSWSREFFNNGLTGMYRNTLVAMSSTLVTSTMSAINMGKEINSEVNFNNGYEFEKLLKFSAQNQFDVGNFNNLVGSLVGQGVNFALGGDFTLNLFNINLFTNRASYGLLELSFSRDGVTMGFGTGGADVSPNTLASALRGIDVLSVNHQISNYLKNNDNISVVDFFRYNYGYGDDIQVSQLWDILNGKDLLRTEENGELSAQTIIDENGKRSIIINGYRQDMSSEDLMRLAVILGQEAYRDGYTIGQIDASGNIITEASSYEEFINASIARIMMGDRINAERDMFYYNNLDFAFERYLLDVSNAIGDYSMFFDYLQIAYNNDEDYFFPRTSTNGVYQNGNEAWRSIPLFNADSIERVNEINFQRKGQAYERYVTSQDWNYEKNPIPYKDFINDPILLEKYGYEETKFISLYLYSCRFMSTIYALEAITGIQYDVMELHKFVLDNRIYSDKSLLSSQDMANIMTKASNGLFTVTVESTLEKPSVQKIFDLESSQQMYIACLQVTGASGGSHYVMLDKVEFKYDNNGNVIGISTVNVSNSWNGVNKTGQQSYTLSEINRWDIFKVTPTNIPDLIDTKK